MLQKLIVKNYALIDELEMVLSPNMSMITGETGAGKSIILGALSLILGNRAPSTAIQQNKKKCVVEGLFHIQSYQLQSFFEAHELDYDDETVIRREVTPSGKSRAFINDTPVNLTILKSLSERLVNLHAQHQTLHLFDANYHLFIIDTLANHFKALYKYQEAFRKYQKDKSRLKKMVAQNAQLQKDMDYLLFQLNEFTEAQLEDPEEQDKLEQALNKLSNADTIQNNLQEGIHLISEQDFSILQQLNQVKSSLIDIVKFNPDIEALVERLDSAVIELDDIHQEMSTLASDVESNPELLQGINERLNLIYRLQKKHQVNTLQELMDIEADLSTQSQSAENMEQDIANLKQSLLKQKANLLSKAQQISTKRIKKLPLFEKKINQLLKKVGMPNARVIADHKLLGEDHLLDTGMDQIEILFSANKGMEPAELRKVASGGELSRLMLCIQSLIADNTALPTLIFDEIDTGISGEVARKVGLVMQQLAQSHQVICITHLPQIASMGDQHFFVYKQHQTDKTYTRIKTLKPTERIVEIAKMLSGDQPGKMALENAKELLNWEN